MGDDHKPRGDEPALIESDPPPPFDPDEDLISYIEEDRDAPIDRK